MELSKSFEALSLTEDSVVVTFDENLSGPWAIISSTTKKYGVGDYLKIKRIDGTCALFRLKLHQKSANSNCTLFISSSSFALFKFNVCETVYINRYIPTKFKQVRNMHINLTDENIDELLLCKNIKIHGLFLDNQPLAACTVFSSDSCVDSETLLCLSYSGFIKIDRKSLKLEPLSLPFPPNKNIWIKNASNIRVNCHFNEWEDSDRKHLFLSDLDVYSLEQLLENSTECSKRMIIFDNIGVSGNSAYLRLALKFAFVLLDLTDCLTKTTVKIGITNQGSWEDIGGYKDLISEVKTHIQSLIQSHEKIFLGFSPPKGILLYGPPGCSKTMIARAVASSMGVSFISIKGPEVFSKWVGDSEKAISDVFKRAKAKSPCVLFFDEFDSIGSSRSHEYKSSVEARVVAQLLSEMDGLSSRSEIIVIAATNRPDVIDPALLRPGRLDLHFNVPLPDYISRLNIIEIILSKTMLKNSTKLFYDLAEASDGFSGAELSSGCFKLVKSVIKGNPISVLDRTLFIQSQ